MDLSPLFANCPNGCAGELINTGIILPEGMIRECSICGLMMSSCIKERYENSNKEWNTEHGTWPNEKDMKRLKRRRKRDLKTISSLLSLESYRLLDIGCSSGSLLYIAKSLGLKAEGIDPAEKAARNGIDRGLQIHIGYLHDLTFNDNTFDAITIYEVIEHVYDPKSLFKECHRILKPNGVLLVGTGNVDSWTKSIRKNRWGFFNMEFYGGHVLFFSKKSFGVLADATGFLVKKVRTSSVTFFEKWEVPFLLYRTAKILSELLNLASALFNKGEQMEIYFIAKK
jgi:2-polyprenyl-3-methyl-5-hydroxy-6-metoxy-1,4-benzoquinol methylase